MIVISDIEEAFMPIPYDLLVNIAEHRNVIESFLRKLPALFKGNTCTESVLGKALKFAEKMIVFPF